MNAEKYIAVLSMHEKLSLREKILICNAFNAAVLLHRTKINMRRLFKFVNLKIRIKFNHKLTIDDIKKAVSIELNMPIELMNLKTRKRVIVEFRQICHFFAKHKTGHTLAYIGSVIGNKDHATVIHSSKVVQNLIDTNHAFRNKINNIESRLKKY